VLVAAPAPTDHCVADIPATLTERFFDRAELDAQLRETLEKKLACPVVLVSGTRDTAIAPMRRMRGFAQFTTGKTTERMLDGPHDLVRTAPTALLSLVADFISSTLLTI
jgi:surfactin synthase thioesterase subunit